MAIPKYLMIDVGAGSQCPDQGAFGNRTDAQLNGLAIPGPVIPDVVEWWELISGGVLRDEGQYLGSVTFGIICATTIQVYYEIDRDNSNVNNYLQILVDDVEAQFIDLNTLGAGTGANGSTSIVLPSEPCGSKVTFNGSMWSEGGQDIYLYINLTYT